jgi:hypothetical protein
MIYCRPTRSYLLRKYFRFPGIGANGAPDNSLAVLDLWVSDVQTDKVPSMTPPEPGRVL